MDRFQQVEPEQRMLMVSGPWTSVGYSNVSVSKWPLKAGAFVNLTFARLEYFIYSGGSNTEQVRYLDGP